ncbi:MAG: hypothetical protein Q9163_005285 [Psora crenata]
MYGYILFFLLSPLPTAVRALPAAQVGAVYNSGRLGPIFPQDAYRQSSQNGASPNLQDFNTLASQNGGLRRIGAYMCYLPDPDRAPSQNNGAQPKPALQPNNTGDSYPNISQKGIAQVNSSAGGSNRDHPCGPVSQYYKLTPEEWKKDNVDEWLNDWWSKHASDIATHRNGFAGAFGEWALGDPHWSCRDDGSDSACDFNPCNNPVLNGKGNETKQALAILNSLRGVNSYFQGLREAFEVSSIAAALTKDSWATTFYRDKDNKNGNAFRQLLSGIATAIGLAAVGAGMGESKARRARFGAVDTIFTGAAAAAYPSLGKQSANTFERSAEVGAVVGKVVVDAIKSFTAANNVLMDGKSFMDSGDIRDYIKDGSFVDFEGVNKNEVTDNLSNMLVGQAINQLWRKQKIFILGGGKCGDGQGIGQGPKDYTLCREGKAWYLYLWQENDVISLTPHQWGWAAAPPGADKLGSGDYASINVTTVIDSSLDAYFAAGYNYTLSVATSRVVEALGKGETPGALSGTREGMFTIPVCDVSGCIGKNYQYSGSIMLEHGHDNRMIWCGPVCNQDLLMTQQFIIAANMFNFKSPKRLCRPQPGY